MPQKKKGRPKELEGIKPIEVPFAQKLTDDKSFVLALIDDPVKAFRLYGYNGDDKMMSMLRGMSDNIHQRAIRVFGEILNLAGAGQACDACNGCRACKACMTFDAGKFSTIPE